MPEPKDARMSIQEYIEAWVDWITKLLNAGDIDEQTAFEWEVHMLQGLGFTGRDDYLARIGEDTRTAVVPADHFKIPKHLTAVEKAEVGAWIKSQQAEKEKVELEVQRREEAWATQDVWGLGREPTPTPPTAEPLVREFLEEERPAGIQRFIEAELPGVLEQFQREQTGARRAWWTAIQRPTYEQEIQKAESELERWTGIKKAGYPDLWEKLYKLKREKGAPLVARDVMPSEWLFLMSSEKITTASRRLQQLQGLTPERIGQFDVGREAEDPLKAYLAQYPWQAEFLKLSPQQRGFQPGRYAPSARWFV